MANVGFAIANENLNTDAKKDLKRSSEFGELKVYRWGNASITPDSNGDGVADITHDLNYAPSHLVFVKLSDGSWAPIGAASTLAFGDATATIFGVSDDEKLRIQTIGGFSKLASLQRDFRYYLLVDKAEGFVGSSNVELTGDRGFKISEDDVDVFTGQEYQMKFSTKYKSLQYYAENIKQETLTLPLMFSSYRSQDNSEFQYVDFNHGLGYAPLFVAYFSTGSSLREIPFNQFHSVLGNDFITQLPFTSYEVNGKCDSTKVRIEFRRRSIFDLYQWLTDSGWASGGQYAVSHAAQTITVTIVVFAENLEGLSYGE